MPLASLKLSKLHADRLRDCRQHPMQNQPKNQKPPAAYTGTVHAGTGNPVGLAATEAATESANFSSREKILMKNPMESLPMENPMKKRILAPLLVSLCAVLAACGTDSDKRSAEPTAAALSPDARYERGKDYETGTGVDQSDSAAAGQYRLAATAGHADAQYRLALLHEAGGEGVPQDDAEAVRLLEQASTGADTNADAQQNLAFRYATGNGVTANPARAIDLLEHSARGDDSTRESPYIPAGNTQAQLDLATRLEHEDGIPADRSNRLEDAATLYRLAATKGNHIAQNALGTFYERGIGGLPQDHDQAAIFYAQAAAQGNADAQNNLGQLYDPFHNRPRNYV
ncbi:MAG: sel1 repeat family protein, partial [Cellvibrionales bacterium]|nr:sel1 repeat family protein [Cellvibrionales bacterium]